MPSAEAADWYTISNVDEIDSPALLVYPQRIRENILRMIACAGGVQRLRPHIKTHKTREVIQIKQELGITKFKCATIAEAELLAECAAPDVLLAFPVIGPKLRRFVRLTRKYPRTRFSVIADNAAAIRALAATIQDEAITAAEFAQADQQPSGAPLEVLLDLDVGMGRSGVVPGPLVIELYSLLARLPGIAPGGLHVYDGHLRDPNFQQRCQQVQHAMAQVDALRARLLAAGLPVPRVVAGGTPTFPVHALRDDVELGPGTAVYWDASYTEKLPDMDYLNAAMLLGRVISKPSLERLCLDLGYKAVSPDNPDPRVTFPDIPDARMVVHSEEHLTILTSRADEFPIGSPVYAVPYHICPTCALHKQVWAVHEGRATEQWLVAARDRKLTI